MGNENAISLKPTRIWNRYFVSIFIYALICQFTMTVTNYVLPLYVVNELHGSVSVSGILSTAFAAGSMVCRFATGNLTDKYGRRNIMIIGALIVAASMFVLGLTSTIAIIILFKVVQGVGNALNSTASNAAAADVVPKDKYSEGIGYYAMHQTLISAFGATIVIWLMAVGTDNSDNYRLPLMVAGVCGIIATLVAVFLNYEKKLKREPAPVSKKKFDIHDYIEVRSLVPALLTMFQCLCTGSGMFLLLYATELDIASYMSIYYIIHTVVSVGTRFTIGRVVGKMKLRNVVVASVVLQISGYLAVALFPGIPGLFYNAFAIGLGSAILQPVLNTLCLKSAPESRSGAASATYWLGTDIGLAITPTVFGLVVDAAGYSVSFIVGAICMGIFAVVAWFVLRGTKPLDEIEQPVETANG